MKLRKISSIPFAGSQFRPPTLLRIRYRTGAIE